jgi:hypothetical protein
VTSCSSSSPKQLDPYDGWGGLSRTITPDGLVLYLCAEHARECTKPSPRPYGISTTYSDPGQWS